MSRTIAHRHIDMCSHTTLPDWSKRLQRWLTKLSDALHTSYVNYTV